VGPRAGLDTEAGGKILCLCRESNLDSPVVQLIATHNTDRAARPTVVYLRNVSFQAKCKMQLIHGLFIFGFSGWRTM
jgi:hypothetical protein